MAEEQKYLRYGYGVIFHSVTVQPKNIGHDCIRHDLLFTLNHLDGQQPDFTALTNDELQQICNALDQC